MPSHLTKTPFDRVTFDKLFNFRCQLNVGFTHTKITNFSVVLISTDVEPSKNLTFCNV